MSRYPIPVELKTRHLFPSDEIVVAARRGAEILETTDPAPRRIVVSIDPISTGHCLARLQVKWEASEITVNQIHDDPIEAIRLAYDVAALLLTPFTPGEVDDGLRLLVA
jgi:hypothetical protein